MVGSGTGPARRADPQAPQAQRALREAAAGLLADGKVDVVIGYARSPAGEVVPRFARRREEAEGLLWDERCTYNLVRYLSDRDFLGAVAAGGSPAAGGASAPGASPRVAVTLKGCDLKSLFVLLAENQVSRDALSVIGLRCAGVVDEDGRGLSKCRACPEEVRTLRTAGSLGSMVQLLVGEPVSAGGGGAAEPTAHLADPPDVAQVEAMSRAERRDYWDLQFSRCLRCYACRNVCPLCYCRQCVFDQHNPQWVSPAPAAASNRAFHLIRAYHLAGRCVECGECERACPVGIPLGSINRKAAQVVRESFHFEAGVGPEGRAPIAAFAPGDPQEFIE